MLGIIGFVILILAGIAILGPEKLPAGVEGISLNLSNFARSQSGETPLTLEQARDQWERSDSLIYSIVRFLRAAEEHLVELRGRIFKTLISFAITAVIAGVASNYILRFLVNPLGIDEPDGPFLIFLHPTEMFATYIKVIVSTAIGLAVPVILYHVLAFIKPALENPREEQLFKLIVFVAVPLSLVFFAGGVAFSYFVMLPFALNYLTQFGSAFAEAAWNIQGYIDFVTSMLLWIGLAFQTPLVMFVLARAGIVSGKRFSSIRKYAYVGIAAAAAVITPTPDAFNMLLVMIPLALLYELGVLLSRIGGKRAEPETEPESGDEDTSELQPPEPEAGPDGGTGAGDGRLLQLESGPEVESEAESLAEPELDTESEGASEPEPDADTEVVATAESKAKALVEFGLEAAPEAEPEVLPEAEPEILPEGVLEPGSEAELEAESGAEPELEAEAESEPEPEIEAQPGVELEAESGAEPEPEAEAESEAKPEILTEAEAEPSSEPEVETAPGVVPESEAETRLETRAKVELEAESGVEPEPEIASEPEAESEPAPEIETQPETGLAAEPEIETKPEADLETESGIETQPEAETEAGPEPDFVPEPEAEPKGEPADEATTESESNASD